MGILGRFFSRSQQPPEQPDRPVAFGYKICWLAVRSDDPEVVARWLQQRLGAVDCRSSTWERGMSAAREGRGVFVSPALDGWVLAVGIDDGGEALAIETSRSLRTIACFFGSHRVSSYVEYALADSGALLRSYRDADGAEPRNVGVPSDAEVKLGGSLPQAGSALGDDSRRPDEIFVVDLAGAWSIDPRELSRYPATTLGRLVLRS